MGNQCQSLCNKPIEMDKDYISMQSLRNKISNSSEEILEKHKPSENGIIVFKAEKLKELNSETKIRWEKEEEVKIPQKMLRESFINYPEIGPYRYPDGSTYLGQFKSGKRHGFGQWISSSGHCIYEGLWLDDEESLYGRTINRNGDVYKGEMRKGKFHGYGELRKQDGYSYQGYWFQGFQDANGDETFPDNSVYSGEFKTGKRHGKGVLIEPDGTYYTGDFYEGYKHGFGEEKSSDGSTYKGNWKKGKKNGKGEMIFPNGTRFVGNYQDGLKENYGEFYL